MCEREEGKVSGKRGECEYGVCESEWGEGRVCESEWGEYECVTGE